MESSKKSPTYHNLTDLYFKLSQMAKDSSLYSSTIDNSGYRRTKTEHNTSRIRQPLVMADTSFLADCSNQEWLLIKAIMNELKEYNCLWECNKDLKKNSKNRIAISSLIDKNILQKTETTNIYVVNPFYIRRGDLMGVITTTAKLLDNCSKVDATYITNKKPVDDYTPTINQQQITYYGYSTDESSESQDSSL